MSLSSIEMYNIYVNDDNEKFFDLSVNFVELEKKPDFMEKPGL